VAPGEGACVQHADIIGIALKIIIGNAPLLLGGLFRLLLGVLLPFEHVLFAVLGNVFPFLDQMPNYYYIDANGRKQGLINEHQLQTLARNGIITPYTPLKTESGQKLLAEEIPGLFHAKPSVGKKKSSTQEMAASSQYETNWTMVFVYIIALAGVIVFAWLGLSGRLEWMHWWIDLCVWIVFVLTCLVFALVVVVNFLESLKTPKQKCRAIGGLFIVIGIILSFVGSTMERHNRSLLADLNLAEREKQHAIWQSQQGSNVTFAQQMEAIGVLKEATSESIRAEMKIRDSAHSPDLILLLRGLGGFLLLFGFVLIVVGWIINTDGSSHEKHVRDDNKTLDKQIRDDYATRVEMERRRLRDKYGKDYTG